MRGITRLFGRIGRRSFFVLLAINLVFSQLAFMAPVFALDSTLSGTVTVSSSNTPIQNATVEILDNISGDTVTSASTNATGFYSITVSPATYDVRVTPPAGSGYRESIVNDIDLNTNQIQNFILVHQSEFLYAGTLVDQDGNALSDWPITLRTLGGSRADETMTGPLGTFSMSVPAGDYIIETGAGGVSQGSIKSLARAVTVAADMPNQTLTVTKVKFTINVVDPDGNPVNGINAYIPSGIEATYFFSLARKSRQKVPPRLKYTIAGKYHLAGVTARTPSGRSGFPVHKGIKPD